MCALIELALWQNKWTKVRAVRSRDVIASSAFASRRHESCSRSRDDVAQRIDLSDSKHEDFGASITARIAEARCRDRR
jgi:hypothetical protein